MEEATYICDSCGEEIVIPVDVSAGRRQQFTEDCPVCCHPCLICIDIDESGNVYASGESEQDLH